MVLFDVETLLRWKGPPAGIPRVIAQLSRQFLQSRRIRFVTYSQRKHAFVFLNKGQKRVLASMLSAATPRDPGGMLSQEGDNLCDSKTVSRKDIFLGCGVPWGRRQYVDCLAKLKEETGCFVSYLIYDIIPVLLPQTYGSGLPAIFAEALVDLLWISDHIFAISENTKRDLQNFMQFNQIGSVAVTTVRLGDSPFLPVRQRAAAFSAAREYANGYVLTVGTIEARKNHRLLYEVWRRLSLSLKTKCPSLLIVGRKGWLTNDLVVQMKADPLVNRLIEIQSDVDDQRLESAYRNSLFTVYPSFYEGWGLPIAESLARGKFCLASNSSSMREIAGDLIEYFDPYSIDQAYAVISKYLRYPQILRRKEAQIRRRYRPRPWDMTASEFFRQFEGRGWIT